jgi:hypothetical protein
MMTNKVHAFDLSAKQAITYGCKELDKSLFYKYCINDLVYNVVGDDVLLTDRGLEYIETIVDDAITKHSKSCAIERSHLRYVLVDRLAVYYTYSKSIMQDVTQFDSNLKPEDYIWFLGHKLK